MTTKLLLSFAACALAGAADAQDIDYEIAESEYVQPAPELDEDVVTPPIVEEKAERGAVRVIPARQAQSAFVGTPVDQTMIAPEDLSLATRTSALDPVQPLPTFAPAPGAPIIYAYPDANGSYYTVPAGPSGALYRRDQADARIVPRGNTNVLYLGEMAVPGPVLSPGPQIVAFDRATWLGECRARLDTHDESERERVIGALMGTAAGGVAGNRTAIYGDPTEGTVIGLVSGAATGAVIGNTVDDREGAGTGSYRQCQTYLNEYITRARHDVGQTRYYPEGQYMLVPVTVLVPQRAVYSDGTPVD